MAQRNQHLSGTQGQQGISPFIEEDETTLIGSCLSQKPSDTVKLKLQKPKNKMIEPTASANRCPPYRKHYSKKAVTKRPSSCFRHNRKELKTPCPSTASFNIPAITEPPKVFPEEDGLGNDTHSNSIDLELEQQIPTHLTDHNVWEQMHAAPPSEELSPLDRYLEEGTKERYSLFCVQTQDIANPLETRHTVYTSDIDLENFDTSVKDGK